ncbi:MAG: efflux RND transporter periplasmic adaptor subunit [Butyrivibrio sp.]|nr:efflux RND transporter periplasmic adaptor subunit [Butyrivibrio sp.]
MKKGIFKTKLEDVKNWTLSNKKKAAILYGSIAVILIAIIVLISVINARNTTETVYKEETVTYGSLTVGITEDGNIEVGTSTQTMEVDISAYSGGSDFSWGQMGGGGMGGGNTNGSSTSSDSDSDDDRVLEVESVYISVGQVVSEGDKIAKLTEESVTSIRSELEADLADAQNTYDQTVAEQTVTDQEAESTYSVNALYGDYAQNEYNNTVQTLQDAIDDAQEALDSENENLAELQAELAEDEANLPEYQKILEEAEYSLSTIDQKTELYGWVTAEDFREDAQSLVDNTEDEIEELIEEIEESQTKVTEYEIALANAQKEYAAGVIEAQATYDKRMLYYNNADEYKNVTMAQSALSVEEALNELTNAQEKLDEFDSYIVDNEIISGYNGVIASVSIAAGDELYSGSEVMTVNDYDEVTVTVEVDEDDISAAELGAEAKVNIEAFPDSSFDATVTDIGDATYDSSSETTYYEITVTLSGDTSELYSGMTSDVTFITDDSEDVLYISNRAVTRENGKSYVKVKNENGSISTKEITTGFSDGSDVEVIEGLEEGDIVIIESTVTG